MRRLGLWGTLWVSLCALGCAQSRTVVISTRPPDALIKVDGVDRGHGPVTEKFEFRNPDDIHSVVASRPGYKEQVISITPAFGQDELVLQMRPLTRKLTFTVRPVPAIVLVDGTPITQSAVTQISTDLEFTLDEHNSWTSHKVTAERSGYQTAEATVTWTDREPSYVLDLEAQRKDLSITTTPEGAEVFLDGQSLGISTVTYTGRQFPVDPKTNEFVPQRLKALKAGYPPRELDIGWEDGKTDYHLDLEPYSKTVRIPTDPPGAAVRIDGATIEPGSDGVPSARLVFPPVNEKGDLKTYSAVVSKTAADSEWEPEKFTISWDGGRSEYRTQLKEIKTRPVALLRMKTLREKDAWRMVPDHVTTLAFKDTNDGPNHPTAKQIVRFPKGTSIDALSLSPDGSQLLYAVLSEEAGELRSQIFTARTDGSGKPQALTDSKSLDVTPAFTPDGTQVVFASNRATRRLSIWSMSTTGEPGVSRMTAGETNDLWPSVDSDPKPRLFFQSLVDQRPDPRLFVSELGSGIFTDLTPAGGGLHPRVGPKNDAILFAALSEKTGRRDLFRMSDRGGAAVNLTRTDDVDEFDGVWSVDGGKIAFVSDRNISRQTPDNYDLWVLDLAHPDKPIQITTNGSCDDTPAWDVTARALYFRSNRGGEWGIWKIDLK